MDYHYCINQCCRIVYKPYTSKWTDSKHKYKKLKAGIFFHDTATDKILLVQSRGIKWGPPKGSMEDVDESIEDCAIRETFEETGIMIDKNQLSKKTVRFDKSTYFYQTYSETDVTIPNIDNNDATGISWIKLDCLLHMYEKGLIDLNAQCKRLLRRIFQINIT